MSLVLTSLLISVAALSVENRVNLADFGRVVRFEGDSPRSLRSIAIERGPDGWQSWVDEEGVAWIGVEWDRPRVITEVEIEFRHAVADRQLIQVEFFAPEPLPDPSCGGRPGYDAFHGRWMSGRTDWWAGDRFVGFEFLGPVGTQPATADPLGGGEAGFLCTSRLRFNLGRRDYGLPPVRYIRVYGPHTPCEARLDVRLDDDSPLVWPIEVEVTDGKLLNHPTYATTRTATLDPDGRTLHVRYHGEARGANRTIVTLRSAGRDDRGFSFLPDEVVARGIVRVPSLGVTISDHAGIAEKPSGVTSAASIHDGPSLPAPAAEQKPADTGSRTGSTVPARMPVTIRRLPRPEGVVAIELPEPEVQAFVERCLNELAACSAGPDRAVDGDGMSADRWTAIVGAMHHVGFSDAAARWIDEVLTDQSRCPLPGRFADSEGALCIACEPDAEAGCASIRDHGAVLAAAGEHYGLTRDRFWLTRRADALAAACDFILRHAHAQPGAGAALPETAFGLLPAGGVDGSPLWYHWLAVNAEAADALRRVADAFIDINHPEAARLGRAADSFFGSVTQHCREAMLGEPVIRLQNGMYVPCQPRRIGFDNGGAACAPDSTDPTRLIEASIYDARSREAGWILAACKQPTRADATVLPRLVAHLRRGERADALRLFYNALANIVDDGSLIWPDATSAEDRFGDVRHFAERARCLQMLRQMLVHEWYDGLVLLAGAPMAWLEPGACVAFDRMPTLFGRLDLRAEVAADDQRVDVVLEASWHESPDGVLLHLNRPARIRRVTLNGVPISTFNPGEGTVSIDGPITRAHVVVFYSGG